MAATTTRVALLEAGDLSTAPASVATKCVTRPNALGTAVDVLVRMSAGSDTFALMAWDTTVASWCQISQWTANTADVGDGSWQAAQVGGFEALAIYRVTAVGTIQDDDPGAGTSLAVFIRSNVVRGG